MGIKGWARMLAEEGFLPDQAGIVACCNGSLWRNSNDLLAHVEAIPPHSTLHIDGNGMAFFLHQIAYARQIDEALHYKRRSEKTCAVPQEVTTGIHAFLPNFLSLAIVNKTTKEFIEALLSKNLRLVVYWDGDARRSYKQQTDDKRTEHRNDETSNLHQYCQHGRLPACSSVCQWEYEFPKTKLFKTEIIHALTQLNIEMVECPEEADPYMARLASGDAQSFILGNDTDFCGFKDVQYVPFSTMHASSRGPLTASVIRRCDVADRLGIDDSLMVELAILCGNDYIPNPSAAGLSFYARDFQEKIDFLQSVGPGFRLTTKVEEMEEILAFVRASYDLESLDEFPLDDSDSDDDEEDVGSVLSDVLNVTMDIEPGTDVAIAIDSSLLRVRPSQDKSVMYAVIRCIKHYTDTKAHLEDGLCSVLPLHVQALRELKLDETRPSMPVSWRPEWKDVVAVHMIEKCLDASFKMNMKSPLARVCPPHRVFDQWRYHVLLHRLRNGGVDDAALDEVDRQLSPAQPPKLIAPLKLPIDEFEDSILDMISNNRVSIIQGSTGCGKSSRIPAMLLKNYRDVKLFICQPRRIAAKALVERLRDSEPELRDMIALRMGHGHREYESNATKAWFVTTGYLVRLLANHPERFDTVTHLIIDEVHERSVDTDILCLLCRRLLNTNTNIRLVLMSATLAATLYQEYFDIPTAPLKVGARRFPVEEVFLDDLPGRFNLPVNIKKAVATIKQGCDSLKCRASPSSQVMEKLHMIACHLALVIGSPGSSVLIFVPGMMDIVAISERIEQLYVPGVRFTTFPIHSDIPFEDQMNVFAPTERDEVKIIIATNAAESSVTLPDVDHVICLGLCKQILYNELSHRQILTPTWISKASATQRAGRTGRLRPGTCYRLYTRQNYDEHMADFEPGEILRIPLDSVILMLKEMLKDEEVTEVLQDCIEPPNTATIQRSFKSLFDSQFITSPSGDCEITQLGLFVSALGVDLALGSLVGLGIQFGVAAEVIQLAGILSFPQPPWIMSNPLVHDANDFNEMTKRTFISRCQFDANLFSEPLAAMNLLWEFEEVKRDARKTNGFCQKHGLVIARLRRLQNTCNNLRLRIATYFEIDEDRLRITDPPSRMPHAKVTVLRVLQAWVFCDSVVECRFKQAHVSSITSAGYALEFGPRSDTVTEDHLRQVLSKDRHPFTLLGCSEVEQRLCFMYIPKSLEAGRLEERFLSYAIDKGISIVWLWDKECMAVYIATALFTSLTFATLAGKLRERLGESVIAFEANAHRRGIGERACGRWKATFQTAEVSGNERVKFHRFLTGTEKIPKEKLDNMKSFHLNKYLKENPSVKGLKCDFSTGATSLVSFNSSELTSQDVRDLMQDKLAIVSKGRQKAAKQTILFQSSPNMAVPNGTEESSTSWGRPLIDCIPEGARLLSVLASSRRKEHVVALQSMAPDGGDKVETLKVHLDRSKTKILGRWKRLGTDDDVFTTENSVPATALSDVGADLYCVASNTLEIRGGGLRVEGLTLLPPGRLFLLLTRLSFGLQSLANVVFDASTPDLVIWRDRLQQAETFNTETENLGEELRCFPEKARQLCALFDGVDGFEGELWDIESNPFTHENFGKLGKGSRENEPDPRLPNKRRLARKATAAAVKSEAVLDTLAPALPVNDQLRRPVSVVAVNNGDIVTRELSQLEKQKLKQEVKKAKAKSKATKKEMKRQPEGSIKFLKTLAKSVPPAMMALLFASDLLQSPEVPSTALPSSNILAHIVRTYRHNPTTSSENSDLVGPSDWVLYRVKVNGGSYFQAKFQSYGIPYSKIGKQAAQAFPAWFTSKWSPLRPTVASDASACLPPQFRDAFTKSMEIFMPDKVNQMIVFDSIEMAVRMEACFWLQRQFYGPDMKNWYEQDFTAMMDKLLTRDR